MLSSFLIINDYGLLSRSTFVFWVYCCTSIFRTLVVSLFFTLFPLHLNFYRTALQNSTLGDSVVILWFSKRNFEFIYYFLERFKCFCFNVSVQKYGRICMLFICYRKFNTQHLWLSISRVLENLFQNFKFWLCGIIIFTI